MQTPSLVSFNFRVPPSDFFQIIAQAERMYFRRWLPVLGRWDCAQPTWGQDKICTNTCSSLSLLWSSVLPASRLKLFSGILQPTFLAEKLRLLLLLDRGIAEDGTQGHRSSVALTTTPESTPIPNSIRGRGQPLVWRSEGSVLRL